MHAEYKRTPPHRALPLTRPDLALPGLALPDLALPGLDLPGLDLQPGLLPWSYAFPPTTITAAANRPKAMRPSTASRGRSTDGSLTRRAAGGGSREDVGG